MDRRLFILALVTMALYAPTVGYGYVYEDHNDLEAFSRPWPMQSADPIADALRHPTRLLRDVSFALSGTDPRGAHLGNVVVHIVNGLLVYAIAASWLSPSGAVLAAGAFWLHPVQVEAVAYISSRADLVATLFLLLTVLSARRVWLSLLCAVLCVLAKETFVMVLLIPLVVGSWDRANRVLWALWALVAMPVVLFGVFAFGLSPDLHRGLSVLTQLSSLLTLWLVPIGLTVDHDWQMVAPLTMALVCGVWLVLMRLAVVQGFPRWSQALGVIVLFVLPRMVVPMSEGLHEHHLYAPAIALSLLTGAQMKG